MNTNTVWATPVAARPNDIIINTNTNKAMKKKYLQPQVTVVNMLVENTIMAGSGESQSSLSVSDDETIDATSVNVRGCSFIDWEDEEL